MFPCGNHFTEIRIIAGGARVLYVCTYLHTSISWCVSHFISQNNSLARFVCVCSQRSLADSLILFTLAISHSHWRRRPGTPIWVSEYLGFLSQRWGNFQEHVIEKRINSVSQGWLLPIFRLMWIWNVFKWLEFIVLYLMHLLGGAR